MVKQLKDYDGWRNTVVECNDTWWFSLFQCQYRRGYCLDFFSKLFQHTTEGLSLLCGGFLVGLLVLDIIPTSVHMYKSFGIILGIIIGYLMFKVLSSLFHPAHSQNPSVYLLAFAMIIHTIPISLTVGNLLGNSALGITITASIILHHLPEGFAVSTALLSQGEKLWRLLLYFFRFFNIL